VWKKGAYWEQTKSYPYDDAIKRAKIAMQDGALKGILWHQGSSDSNENDAGLYEDRLAALIERLRTDLGVSEVSFIAATLGDFIHPDAKESNTLYPSQIVNAAIRNIPERVKNAAYVESTGLKPKSDNLHFDSASARELGRRFAEAMIRLDVG